MSVLDNFWRTLPDPDSGIYQEQPDLSREPADPGAGYQQLWPQADGWHHQGSAGLTVNFGGLIHANTGTASSAAIVAEQTLMSFTLPANFLNTSGRGVKIRAWGTTAANARAKTIRLYFGATIISVNDITPDPNGLDWLIDATVFRVGAVSQEAVGVFQAGAIGQTTRRTAPAETLSGTVLVKVTAEIPALPAAADVVQQMLMLEYA